MFYTVYFGTYKPMRNIRVAVTVGGTKALAALEAAHGFPAETIGAATVDETQDAETREAGEAAANEERLEAATADGDGSRLESLLFKVD